MRLLGGLVMLALAGIAGAQRPSSTSICDYYTMAIFQNNNTAASQLSTMSRLIQFAFRGTSGSGANAAGILQAGMVNGTSVELSSYFDGSRGSANRNGKATTVNFLDGGGYDAITSDSSANSTASNQYSLFEHLHQFFGFVLGCSQQGKDSTFPAYQGQKSMYEAHKYMALDYFQVTYFMQRIGVATSAMGFSTSDITTLEHLLGEAFNNRCGRNITLGTSFGSQQQSLCLADNCPIAAGGNCTAYPAVAVANSSPSGTSGAPSSGSSASDSSASGPSTTGSGGSGSSSSPASPPSSPGAALSRGAIAGIVVGGIVAFCIVFGVLGAAAKLCYRRRNGRGGNGRTAPSVMTQQYQGGHPSLLPPGTVRKPVVGSSTSPDNSALSAQNLDRHLAGEEWAGIRRDVPQKQTAYLNVTRQNRTKTGRRYGTSEGDGISDFSELRYKGDATSGTYSEEPLTAMYPASESVVYSEEPLTATYPASESVRHDRA